MRIQEITDNIVVASFLDKTRSKINDAPQTANITCISLPEQLIFVDCGVYTKVIAQFRKEMEDRFQRKTSHLLLTHTHWDHILSMKAFKDVDIVLAKKGIPTLKRNYKGYLSYKERIESANNYRKEDSEIADDIENSELFLPNIRVKDELIIGSEEQLIIYKIIGIHTSESAYVHIPSEKTLCTGDNLLTCYPQLIKASYDSLEMFREWEKMDVEHFIPGHGILVKTDYVRNVRLYYENLVNFLKNQISQNATISDVLKNTELPRYFAVDHSDWRYSCKPNDNWLEGDIRHWYKFLETEQKKG
ncbi:MAG: MBL fold metallo-hydrolase [Candidatus Heimdallarchaeota archaeon]|nr:MBL fold metallo-hydrolase [Candidatus Heimdallarchaeota archaeon]MCK4877707.1 MBL fold metallo-hydrolase [Candidatus Heimdallarchaeota archaeon]